MTPAVMTAKPMTNKFDDRFADSCHEVSSRSVITRSVSSFEEGHHMKCVIHEVVIGSAVFA
jgi:hypothetical protein